MSESIKFNALVEQVLGGDDEIRLVLSVNDFASNPSAPVSMLGKLNRVLRVTVYLARNDEALAEFRATIPPIKTGVQFRANRSPIIKLDIPASDGISALRLVGYNEKVLRFEVSDEGDKPKKEKARKPKEKTPHGELWQELLHRDMGFEFIPGVKEDLEAMRGVAYEEPHQLMRKVFGVKSLSLEVGKDEIYAKWPPNEYPTVKTLVTQALDRIKNRQPKATPDNNGAAKSAYEDEGDGFQPESEPFYDPAPDLNIYCDATSQNS